MKQLAISIIALISVGCTDLSTKENNMEQATIIELVVWKSKEGISTAEAKASITTLNDFVKIKSKD